MTWEQGALERTVRELRPMVAEIRGNLHELESHITVAVRRLSGDPGLQDARSVRDRLHEAIEILGPAGERESGIVGELRQQYAKLDGAITSVEELS